MISGELAKRIKDLMTRDLFYISLVLLLSLTVNARIISLPGVVSFWTTFITYGIVPGYLILKLMNRRKLDWVEAYAQCLFLSLALFAPFAFVAYLLKLKYIYLIVIYDCLIGFLLIWNMIHSKRRFLVRSIRWAEDRIYYVFLGIIVISCSVIAYIGIGVAFGGDVAHIMSYVRKLAETEHIYPYGVLTNYNHVNYFYSYNSYLLFLSLLASVSGLDTVLAFVVSSVYSFILTLTDNRSIAIFVSLLFTILWYCMSIFFERFLFRGYIAIPSLVIYPMLVMVMTYFSIMVIYKRGNLVGIVGIGSFLLFSTHGQGIVQLAWALMTFLALGLLFIKKVEIKWKLVIVTLAMIIAINIPYLYVAKMKSIKGFDYHKTLFNKNQKKSLNENYFNHKISLTNSLFIISPRKIVSVKFILAVFCIFLLHLRFRDPKATLVYASSVVSLPFFLLNPLVVPYGEKYIGSYQIMKFIGKPTFVWIGFYLCLGILVLIVTEAVFHGLKSRGLISVKWWDLVGLCGVIVVLTSVCVNLTVVKTAYAEIFKNRKVMTYAEISQNEVYGYLKNQVPARSTIFNLTFHYFPVTVVSNNFVTFPGKMMKHIWGSPPAIARRDYLNSKAVEAAVKQGDYREFFRIFRSYNCNYVLMKNWQRRKLEKSSEFKKTFVNVSNEGALFLYKYISDT
jgi:hypothetical protein